MVRWGDSSVRASVVVTSLLRLVLGDLGDRGPQRVSYASEHFGAWVSDLSLDPGQVRGVDVDEAGEPSEAEAELLAPAPDLGSPRLHIAKLRNFWQQSQGAVRKYQQL